MQWFPPPDLGRESGHGERLQLSGRASAFLQKVFKPQHLQLGLVKSWRTAASHYEHYWAKWTNVSQLFIIL